VSSRVPAVVAFGGGHGLSVTLEALLNVTPDVTGIVGVIDDGGSSGRLRSQLSIVPPGDLRMALAAMIPRDGDSAIWRSVLQQRFDATENFIGHPVGNVLMAALWGQTHDVLLGLQTLATATGARGRVLPAALEPVDLLALMETEAGGEPQWIRGQATISSTRGKITELALDPAQPTPCVDVVTAIDRSTAVVFGPGSWFTSVMPHLLLPHVYAAVSRSSAPRILVLNLGGEAGETEDFAPATHLNSWAQFFPEVSLDYVIADQRHLGDVGVLRRACGRLGAELHVAEVSSADTHDIQRLGVALDALIRTADRPDESSTSRVQG